MAAKDPDCSDHKTVITARSEDETEKKFYSMLSEDIPEELLQKFREELKETEEKKEEGITILREYMRTATERDCSDNKPSISEKSEDGAQKEFYSILREDIPEELLQKFREELKETEERKDEGITILREYMRTAKDPYCSDHKPFITVRSEDGTEKKFYSIFSEDIPEEMLQKAKEEVKETEEKKEEGIRILRKYMRKENMTNVNDGYVIAVLRCCKYDIKKSKTKLAKFIKMYKMIISKLRKFQFDEIGLPITELGIGLFPYRDSKGRVIMFARSFSQLCTTDMELMESGFLAVICYILNLPHASLLGLSLVVDSEVPEVRYYYPVMKLFMLVVPQVVHLPYRLGSVKILNKNVFARLIYRLIRPFVPEKINKRVSFLSSKINEELHKDYPPEIMPEEYGGHLGPMNAKLYVQKMLVVVQQEIDVILQTF